MSRWDVARGPEACGGSTDERTPGGRSEGAQEVTASTKRRVEVGWRRVEGDYRGVPAQGRLASTFHGGKGSGTRLF